MSLLSSLSALENAVQALSNVLLHQGKHMAPEDLRTRTRLVEEGEAAIRRLSLELLEQERERSTRRREAAVQVCIANGLKWIDGRWMTHETLLRTRNLCRICEEKPRAEGFDHCCEPGCIPF